MRAPLSGTQRKDGRWQITVTLTDKGGAKVRRTLYADTQREVQAKAHGLLQENPARQAPVARTVAELMEYCTQGPWKKLGKRTQEQYQWARPRIEAEFGKALVAHLSIPKVYSWVERLSCNPSLSGRSVQVHRNVLRVALQQAVFLGWIKDNPAKGWKAPVNAKPRQTDRLTPEQIKEAIEGEKNRRYKLFLWTLWETGARPSEASDMKASMLDKVEGVWWLYVPGTKTDNAPRLVPITDDLANELMEMPEPWFGFNRRQWTHIWHSAQERMGWRPKRTRLKREAPDKKLPTIYGIRKARVTEWREQGVTDEVWTALAGHEDVELTQRLYDKPTMGRIARQLGLVDKR